MKLEEFYKEIIRIGIDADPRCRKDINRLLKEQEDKYAGLNKRDKDFFDKDNLWNPFADSRIVSGSPAAKIKKVLVGIDIDTAELLLAYNLNKEGAKIDLVMSHHPLGGSLVSFYEVMDLQIDLFNQKGVSISTAEKLLAERKSQVARRVSAANFSKTQDAAKLLGLNLMNAHTPADNLAYRCLEDRFKKKKPRVLKDILDSLLEIPEYRHSAVSGNPPQIIHGSPDSRVQNIHYEFTGGTEGPKEIYQSLSAAGVDTIVAMHLSEEHFKAAKQAHINVVMAGHIASDNVGLNRLLDRLEKKFSFEVMCCSGFVRV
jgi:putative NIF3 family GTP cyclohydrolase 1 type 2